MSPLPFSRKKIGAEFWIRAAGIFFLTAVLSQASSAASVALGNAWLQRGKPDRALHFFEQVNLRFARRAAVYEGAALSSRQLALKDPTFDAVAVSYLRQWALAAPLSGKARVYWAEARIKQFLSQKGGSSQKNWDEISPLLQTAVTLEPGNAWIAFKSGNLALTFQKQWTDPESRKVFQWLKKAARIRYRNAEWRYIENASPYLEPILRRLLGEGFSYERMKSAVPMDYPSQRVWMDFLEKNHLWSFRQRSYPEYQSIAEAYYDRQCARGEKFFQQGKFLQAYYSFRKAFWSRDWGHIRAKAGILAAEYRLGKYRAGKHELMKEETALLLKQISEETDYPADQEILRALQSMKLLKRSEEGSGVYDSPKDSAGRESSAYDASLWWGNAAEKPLTRGAQMNYPLFLGKGLDKVAVQLRLDASAAGAFAVIRAKVNQREVGEFLVDNKEIEKSYSFTYSSTGGKRWLQLEIAYFDPADVKLKFGKIAVEQGDKSV